MSAYATTSKPPKAAWSKRRRGTATGAFGAFRAPEYHGSDVVRVANDDLARRASREMRTWRRSLPKGVKV